MKKIVLATMLSATMMFTALTPAFAESKAPVATESTESADKQITFNDAVDAALKDAGLAKDKVTFSEKMQTFEDGKQVYEIKFIVPGETKYEYVIDEKTGAVVVRNPKPGKLMMMQNMQHFSRSHRTCLILKQQKHRSWLCRLPAS